MFAAISNIFGYLLNLLYELLNNNFGFALIIFSILLRLILLPITIKQQKSIKKTSKIQGELKNLQIKYKNNPEMLNKETMELYKRENVSPFSGCLSAIAQIIIILSVFYLVSQPLTYMKKANDDNSELKTVVEEYKKEISESNSKKTRYIEIATIAKIREDYNSISEKLNNYDKENVRENNEEVVEESTVETVTEVETAENEVEEVAENQENIENSEVQSNENLEEDQSLLSKDDLEKRKSLLEKLNINMEFLGLDLSKVPSENMNDFKVYIIPALYVISSFISIKLTTNMQNKEKKKEQNKKENEVDTMAQMNKSMSYMMPIMAVSIAFIAPLGLALYWFVSNALMIIERFIIKKIVDNKEGEEDA